MHPVLRLLAPALLLTLPAARALPPGVDDAYLRLALPALPPGAAEDTALRDAFLAEHGRKAAAASWQAAMDAHGANADLLVLPGLVASRSAREVWVWAWGAGMNPGEPVEFFVINDRSGHGYESILVTAAQPSDIHRALEFIGLRPGWPANPGKQRLWPKGDRVSLAVRTLDNGGAAPVERPVEAHVLESATRLPLPATNHVFTGSVREPDPQDNGRIAYAADVFSPNAVASTFNLEPAVLDLPRQARKEAVYGTMVCAEQPYLARGKPAFLRLAPHPDFPAGSLRDLRLSVTNRAESLELTLADETGRVLRAGADLAAVLTEMAAVRAASRDTHLRLDLAPTLQTRQLAALGAALSPLDAPGGVKVDPPAGDQLFYRAYTPREEFRDRRQRPFQPWELYLSAASGGGWSARLVILEEKWPEGKVEPDLVETPLPAADPAALVELARGRDFVPAVLFVLGPPDLPHGEVQRWVRGVRKTFPVVYVFAEPAPR